MRPGGGLNVPNLDSATYSGHRSAAQCGQNSAPMNSISGLRSATRAEPLTVCGDVTKPLVGAAARVEIGTDCSFASVAAGIGVPAGGDAWSTIPEPEPPPATLTTTSTTTMTT